MLLCVLMVNFYFDIIVESHPRVLRIENSRTSVQNIALWGEAALYTPDLPHSPPCLVLLCKGLHTHTCVGTLSCMAKLSLHPPLFHSLGPRMCLLPLSARQIRESPERVELVWSGDTGFMVLKGTGQRLRVGMCPQP